MAMSEEKRKQIMEERTSLIKETALALFDEKGYENTTIQEIAQEAEISKGLIYKYFKTKKDILRSYGDTIEHCQQIVLSKENALASLSEFCKRVLMKYKYTGYRAPIRILITCYMNGAWDEEDAVFFNFDNYGKTFLGSIMKKGQAEGLILAGNPAVYGDILWHIVIGYTVKCMNNKDFEITEQDVQNILSLFQQDQ